jgi:hypothetical protein
MSMLYKPSKWVRCPVTKRMVRSNPGREVSLALTAKVKSGLTDFKMKCA